MPGSLVEAPQFSINLRSGGMTLPTMRAPFMEDDIVLNMLPVANSGKLVDELVGLGNDNPTFGCLSASDFASRAAGWEIIEGDGLMDVGIYTQGVYSRNCLSLSW